MFITEEKVKPINRILFSIIFSTYWSPPSNENENAKDHRIRVLRSSKINPCMLFSPRNDHPYLNYKQDYPLNA